MPNARSSRLLYGLFCLLGVAAIAPANAVAGPKGDDGLRVQQEVGTLPAEAVEQTLESQAAAIQECYRDGVAQFRYLGGRLGVKARVRSDGSVKWLRTVEPIGSFDVERCVSERVRALRFGTPKDGAEAEFTYTWEFRSTAQQQRWESTQVAGEFTRRKDELKRCSKNVAGVRFTFYVMPGGKVGAVSVGSPELDEEPLRCLAARVMAWRFADPLGRVARVTYQLSGGKAPANP